MADFDRSAFLQENTDVPVSSGPAFDRAQFSQQNPDLSTNSMLPGSSSQLAIPNSALSPMERGAFGWLKGHDAKMDYLQKMFGEGNVQFRKMDDNAFNYVAKGTDGTWRQVDPHGLSDVPAQLLSGHLGDAWNTIRNLDLRNTAGGAMQMLGEHGIDSTTALAMGGAAAEALGPAALSPWGLAAVAGAGALGAAGGMGIDAGVRKSLDFINKQTGSNLGGAEDVSHDDFNHQLMGSLLFGASQELASPFLRAGGDAAANVFSKVLGDLGNSNLAKNAQASILQATGSLKEGTARIIADDPAGYGRFIERARLDKVNGTDLVTQSQKDLIDGAVDDMKGAMRGLGKKYDSIEKRSSGHVFDALKADENGNNPILDAFQRLKDEGYIDDKNEIIKPRAGEITRDTSGNNGAALKKVIDDMQGVLQKNGQLSFKDLRIMDGNAEGRLFEDNQVSDSKLRNILGEWRAGINTVQSKGLNEVAPGLSDELADLNTTYGPAKELRGVLASKSRDERVDAFLKQITKDDGTYNSNLLNSVSKLLGTNDPTPEILQMQAAKDTSKWFTGGGSVNLFGLRLPGSPRSAGLMAKGTLPSVQSFSAPIQDATSAISEQIPAINEATKPYLSKMHIVYSGLSDNLKKEFVQNPDVLKVVGDMIGNSTVAEKQTTQKLLQQSGAFQNSQFGQ